LAAKHGLSVVYDAAHAFATSHHNRMVGNFGRCEVLSFHATKLLNTLEGGAVMTNDDDLAERLRLMRNFGFRGYDDVGYLGTNGKMNEVSAAMGLTLLDDLDGIVEANHRNFEAYRDVLSGLPGVTMLPGDLEDRRNFQYIVMMIDDAVAQLSRDQLLAVLHAEGVLARRYFYPGCHAMEPYRRQDPDVGRRLPVTRKVADQVLILPTGTAVSPDDISMIGSVLRAALDDTKRVREAIVARE
jgi:dTDP-4-amino-4,6-dideoxygalactose transaminase